jgi:prepilin peptidase CpaA
VALPAQKRADFAGLRDPATTEPSARVAFPRTDPRMPVPTLTHLAVLLFFPALMAMSASLDLLTYTIPNRLCAALALGYLALAAPAGVPAAEILLNLSCAAAILAIAFVLFTFGFIGGGDAKLAAATALWLGWSLMFDYAMAAAIFSGALTLVILTGRMTTLPAPLSRFPWIARLHDVKAGVPYGIALAAAGLIQFPNSHIWTAAI